MKRSRKKVHPPTRRLTLVFLFLSASAVLLYLALTLWPNDDSARAVPDGYDTVAATGPAHPTASPPPVRVLAATDDREADSNRSVTQLPPGGVMAVVIDDAGNDLAHLDRLCKFHGALTVAVLPRLPFSAEAARRVHAAGKEVMLHLPLEPLGNENPGPGVLLVSFNRELIRETLRDDLATVPFAQGVNNHMGSRATQDPALMDALFEYLRDANLYFVDSRTTAATLGREYAVSYGVRMTERNIFLDNNPERGAVKRSLSEGVAEARLKGSILLIGHVQNPVVIDVLEEAYDDLTATGIEFVTVSEYLRRRERHP